MPGANQILSRTFGGNPYQWDAVNGVPPSPSVPSTAAQSMWWDCPIDAILSDPGYGQLYELTPWGVTPATNTIPGWTFTQATSGTFTLDTTNGLKYDAGAVTANQGCNHQMSYVAALVQANKPIWLEGQFKFTALTSLKIQFLFGLAVAQTALITSGAVGTDAKIAFDGVTTSGVIVSDVNSGSTDGTGTGFTIANNGVYTLGIRATSTAVQFFVNHVLVQTLTANIPTVALAPSIVIQANATVEPVVFLKRLQFASLY